MIEHPNFNISEREGTDKLPLGRARVLEASKETLPAIEVKNKVLWANDEIEVPLKLEVGEQTSVGVFLTPNPEYKFPRSLLERVHLAKKRNELSSRVLHVEIRGGHGRSALLGRTIFRDKQGRLYRDIDAKGLGYSQASALDDKMHVGRVFPVPAVPYKQVFGVEEREVAEWTRDISEDFLRAGIRSDRVIAIIELEEVVGTSGRKISVDEAKDKGGELMKKEALLYKSTNPVLVLRAYGTKARIGEYDLGHGLGVVKNKEVNKRALLDDARMLVAEELGIKENNFTFPKYLHWFARTLGVNMARLHKNGWTYKGELGGKLHRGPSNITLDCRFTDQAFEEDVADVGHKPEVGYRDMFSEEAWKSAMEKDLTSGEEDLEKLLTESGVEGEKISDEMKRLFRDAYNSEIFDGDRDIHASAFS